MPSLMLLLVAVSEKLKQTDRITLHISDEHLLIHSLYAYHMYFTILCQNVNVAKQVVSCRFSLIMLQISVRKCMLVPLLDLVKAGGSLYRYRCGIFVLRTLDGAANIFKQKL